MAKIQQLPYTFTYLSSVEGNDGVSLVNGSGSYPQVLKSCDGWNIALRNSSQNGKRVAYRVYFKSMDLYVYALSWQSLKLEKLSAMFCALYLHCVDYFIFGSRCNITCTVLNW